MSNTPTSQAGQSRPRAYFQPGNILLVVEHPDSENFFGRNLAGEIRRDSIIESLPILRDAKIEPGRVLKFRHGLNAYQWENNDFRQARHKDFSFVFLDLRSQLGDDSSRLINLIEELNRRILDPDRLEDHQPLRIKIASPNWIMTPASGSGGSTTSGPLTENAGGSGPGSRPRLADPLDAKFHKSEVDARGTPFGFEVMNTQLQALMSSQTEQEVNVVIFDTVPDRDNLKAAYNRWQSQHPVLRSMLGPDGVFLHNALLSPRYARDLGIDLPLLGELRVKDHDYIMQDHGLFVAGVIHSLATRAKVHLWQVLNDYGVGYLEGIIKALQKLADGEVAQPLIVNLSLTEVMPLSAQHWVSSEDKDRLKDWPFFDEIKDKSWDELSPEQQRSLQEHGLMLEWVCMALHDQGVRMVASAGNDSDSAFVLDKKRPAARFPAAFDSVTGVSALDKDDKPTKYSNKADHPDGSGLATFGGAEDNRIAKPEEAMRGVYIGDFPASNPNNPNQTITNNSGWAWWSGTSFATAVISGLLAKMVGAGASLDQALDALQKGTNKTVDNEVIVQVRQGVIVNEADSGVAQTTMPKPIGQNAHEREDG